MRASFAILLSACAAALGLGACSSGQTGSPDCMGPVWCICDPLYGGGTLLRVRAERFESGKLEAVVQEIFESPGVAFSQLVEGDRVGGSLGGEQPCASGAASSIEVGSEQLVLYSPGTLGNYPNCSAVPGCIIQECSGLEDQALTDCTTTCEASTQQTCADWRSTALLDGYFSWVVLWQDPLDFGGSQQLSTSELDVLRSVEACQEHFPQAPAPPCEDVTSTPLRCAAAPLNTDSSSGSWPFIVAGLALTSLLRRGRRARSPRARVGKRHVLLTHGR
jgi:hypothetical protein